MRHAAVAAVLLGVLAVPAASAHGGSRRVSVDPAVVNAGGTIEVRADGLRPDGRVRLVLVGAGREVDLGRVMTDAEGHLLAFVQLPADVPVGAHEIRAVDEDGVAVEARIEVAGLPPLEPGEPGGRDEDDGLLVALPSGWQQSLSRPAVTARPVAAPPGVRTASREAPWVVIGALGAALVLAALVGRPGVRRPPTPSKRVE